MAKDCSSYIITGWTDVTFGKFAMVISFVVHLYYDRGIQCISD